MNEQQWLSGSRTADMLDHAWAAGLGTHICGVRAPQPEAGMIQTTGPSAGRECAAVPR